MKVYTASHSYLVCEGKGRGGINWSLGKGEIPGVPHLNETLVYVDSPVVAVLG